MLDGRVKTLHPKIHGGLLARRDLPGTWPRCTSTASRPSTCWSSTCTRSRPPWRKAGCTLEDAIENIDIGGPAMVRSAAKNWKDVAVLTDAAQYPALLAELKARRRCRRRDPVRASRWPRSTASANYDGAISDYLSSLSQDATAPREPCSRRRPTAASSSCRTCATARTRTSSAAFYRDLHPAPGSLVTARAAAGQGALVQQHRRRRRGLGMRQELRRAGLRDRQARQPVRRGDRRERRPRPMRKAFKTDPDLGLRRHHRVQRRARRATAAQARAPSSSSKC